MSHRYLKIRSCNECPKIKNNSYSLPYCNQPGKSAVLIIKDLGGIPVDCPLETEYDICTQIKTKFADQILEYLIPKRDAMPNSMSLSILDSVITMIRQMKEVKQNEKYWINMVGFDWSDHNPSQRATPQQQPGENYTAICICIHEKGEIIMSDEKFPQWVIDLIEQAGDKAFEVMCEQYRVNPDCLL